MLRAVYKDENNSWQIFVAGIPTPVIEYTIDLVPKEVILQAAVEHKKLPLEVIFTEQVDNWNELLEWFEQEYFPSKEFGHELLEDFKQWVKEIVEGKQQLTTTEEVNINV